MITAETIDRLKAQLLTSGVQQKNQPLYQVINLLIDAVRQSLSQVQLITGGGGGGGGILAQTFTTVNNDQATLPNSRQLWPGQGIQFNDQGQKLVIGAAYPFIMDGQDGEDGLMGPPGLQGPIGPAGPSGSGMPFGIDCCECEKEPLFPLAIDLAYVTRDMTVTGAWTFVPALFVSTSTGNASIISSTGDAAGVAQILLQSSNGIPVGFFKQNGNFDLGLGSDLSEFHVTDGGGGGNIRADDAYFENGLSVAMGYWQNEAFNAANFTGNGAMTWTLAAADQVVYRWTRIGNTVVIDFFFNLTSVGGVLNTILQVACPGGMTFVSASHATKVATAVDNGASADVNVQVIGGGTWGFLRRDGAAWQASANATILAGQFVASVAT